MKKSIISLLLIGASTLDIGYSKTVAAPKVPTAPSSNPVVAPKFSTVSDPLAGSGGTRVVGVYGNCIVGNYMDTNGNNHGFAYNGVNYKTIDFPNADTGSTVIVGVSSNQIVGNFNETFDSSNNGNSNSFYEVYGTYGFSFKNNGYNQFLTHKVGGTTDAIYSTMEIKGINGNVVYGNLQTVDGDLAILRYNYYGRYYYYDHQYITTEGGSSQPFYYNGGSNPIILGSIDTINGVSSSNSIIQTGSSTLLFNGFSSVDISPPTYVLSANLNFNLSSSGISSTNIYQTYYNGNEYASLLVNVSYSNNIVLIAINNNNTYTNGTLASISYTPIVYPNTSWEYGGTQVTGIYSNALVGNYTDNNNVDHGFYCIGGTNYCTLDCPQSVQGGTYVSGISGNVAFGYYTATNGSTNGFTATIPAIPSANQVSSIVIPPPPVTPTNRLKIIKTKKG